MKRILIFPIAVLGLGILVVAAVRSFAGLTQIDRPVGRCITTALNPLAPDPYVKAQLKGASVGLATSGGGSRAAYLTAAIFREIHEHSVRLTIHDKNGAGTDLLDQFDFISSVSGSALATSYFLKNIETLNTSPAESPLWKTYLDKMAIDYRTEQWYSTLITNPRLWWKFTFSNYNRGTLARDDYDQVLFQGATLADLPDHPALYVNAFDVANNVRFILSKQYVDTTYYQGPMALNQLSAPQDLAGANDLTFAQIDPASVRIADAVYASSAYPIAYPNMALKNCARNKILFQGGLIFLADGGLGDNSGLVTLLTQMKATLGKETRNAAILAVHIDASLNRIDADGSRFQRSQTEDTYAWDYTVIGHARESFQAAIGLIQDVSMRFIESTGAVTDQLRYNWSTDLTRRTGQCGPHSNTFWHRDFETGKLALRPLVIRLGLRDALEPDLLSNYLRRNTQNKRFMKMLHANGLEPQLASFSRTFTDLLLRIETDFALDQRGRRALDLAAYILVHGKLKSDLAAWQRIAQQAITAPSPELECGN